MPEPISDALAKYHGTAFVLARGQSGKSEASTSFLTAQHWHAILEMGNGLAALEQR